MAVTIQNNRNLAFLVNVFSNATDSWMKEEEIFVIQMHNVPRNCTPECIFPENGEPVDVLFGTYGVLMQSCYTRMTAYALFDKRVAYLAMEKNGQTLKNEPVHLKLTNIYEVMFQGFALRKTHDDLEKSKEICLKDIPSCTKFYQVHTFLEPYFNWVRDMAVKNIPGSRNVDIKCLITSEIVAFFLYMKKNGSFLEIDGTVKQIRVSLHSCYSYVARDHTFSIASSSTEPVIYDITREIPTERKWSIVTLSNLPFEITVSDLATIFFPRVMVADEDITLFRETPTTKQARIYFETQGEAATAIGNIACFTLGEQLVSVHIRNVTEHWVYGQSIFKAKEIPL